MVIIPRKTNSYRILIHLSGFSIPFIAQFIDSIIICTILSIMIGLYAISEYLRYKGYNFPIINHITKLATKGEVEDQVILSPIYFSLGIVISLLAFDKPIGYASIGILTLGDSSAKFFGRLIGKIHLPFRKEKTLEGSLIFFLFAFFGAILFVPFYLAIIGAVVGTIVEYICFILDDNILIPVFSGISMTFFSLYLF